MTFHEFQESHDNRLPEDCEEGHDWRYIGRAEDGTTIFRCRKCGIESEQWRRAGIITTKGSKLAKRVNVNLS